MAARSDGRPWLPALKQRNWKPRNLRWRSALVGPPEGFSWPATGLGALVPGPEVGRNCRLPCWLGARLSWAAKANLAAPMPTWLRRARPSVPQSASPPMAVLPIPAWLRSILCRGGIGGPGRVPRWHRSFPMAQNPGQSGGTPRAGKRKCGGLSRRRHRLFSDVEECGAACHMGEQEAALREQVEQVRRFWALRQRKYTAGSADFLVGHQPRRALMTRATKLYESAARGWPAVASCQGPLGGGFASDAPERQSDRQ